MSLIFPRLAHNFIKNGYYPTDAVTLQRVAASISCTADSVRIIDPCCGEGSALAGIKAVLQELVPRVEAFGIELDQERAWHARELLDRAIHSDVHDVVVSPRSMNLLFLNPPYGYAVADKAGTGDPDAGERMEMTFLRKAAPMLGYGGVMVLIVPFYTVDERMATYLARHFDRLEAYMAPEQQFRQSVIFGIRRRPDHPSREVLAMLSALKAGELERHTLPETGVAQQYSVPGGSSEEELKFHAVRLDAKQLDAELQRFRRATLWDGFEQYFGHHDAAQRRPLRDMTRWHLALALAAGQVTGTVQSPDGRVLLIKGDTHKKKERSTSIETCDDGTVLQTVTLIDRFVPVIKAIEFTPGPNLGRIVTIR